MRARIRQLVLILLLIAAGTAVFFWWRQPTQAAFGPAVALCPGPDQYGYTCSRGSVFSYIDATNDTELYQDDGIIELDLPFPFTFYGTTYTAITASSNGNLQFGSQNADFANVCLNEGPATAMGDMVGPYWDDLDLRFEGFLETETVGAAPERIFVIEWDNVPRFGVEPQSDETVTFAAQLFEESNDIVFLYEDVTLLESGKGRSATIGLQSETQGLALQFSCNQPAVADAGAIHFPFPAQPNEEIGQETVMDAPETAATTAKGPVADVVALRDLRQPAALTQLRYHWLRQSPERESHWQWVDLLGNGRSQLLIFWYGPRPYYQLTELALIAPGVDGAEPQLLLHERLGDRTAPIARLAVVATTDLTGDSVPDVLLHDPDSRRLFMVTATSGAPQLVPAPEQCGGSVGVVNRNGRDVIVRDGCAQPGRHYYSWDGDKFTPISR